MSVAEIDYIASFYYLHIKLCINFLLVLSIPSFFLILGTGSPILLGGLSFNIMASLPIYLQSERGGVLLKEVVAGTELVTACRIMRRCVRYYPFITDFRGSFPSIVYTFPV